MPTILDKSHVLLTGATGLIGGEFARHLVKQFDATVVCLVRTRDALPPTERLQRRLTRCGESLSIDELGKIWAVNGDVTQENLGMDPETFRAEQQEIDVIIHSAAETSFIRSQNCHDINIKGTQAVIDFAKRCVRKPLIVYISTACNIGEASGKNLSEDEGCQPDNSHFNAYTQSKAVAEQMIRQSGLPILIIRPSIVLSAGLNEPVFARQILWVAPVFNAFESLPINPDARIDIVPVSFVVDATLKLINLPVRKHDCYHVSAGTDFSIRMADLTALINRHYGKENLLNCVRPSEWTKELTRKFVVTKTQRKLYFSLRYYLPFLNMDLTFDNRRLRQEVDVALIGLTRPNDYIGGVLSQINLEDALKESQNP
jgi:thioester reductase-like protein